MILLDFAKQNASSDTPRGRLPAPLIVCHVTDVPGGFGPNAARAREARAALLGGDLSAVKLPPVSVAGANSRNTLAELLWRFQPSGLADRLGIWDRYRRLDYHVLVGANAMVRVHQLDKRTAHAGKRGNRGAGFAVDVGRHEELSDETAAMGRLALKTLVYALQKASGAERVQITAHRNFSARRLPDPGPNVWRRIVLPVVEALDGLAWIDPDFCELDGKPIPESWSTEGQGA